MEARNASYLKRIRTNRIEFNNLAFQNHLGEGQYAVVFKGLYTQGGNKTEVAIKSFNLTLHPSSTLNHMIALDPNKQFSKCQKEKQIMEELMNFATESNGGKYLVHLYGASFSYPCYYLVMEYLPEGDLRHYLNRKPDLAAEKRLKLMNNITMGVNYMHSLKIGHRDIKPENILIHIDQEGAEEAKLCDFGFAKEMKNKKVRRGSPAYMAPEILNKTQPFTIKSDIFSLGITFWELTTNKEPYAEHLFTKNNDVEAFTKYIKNGGRETTKKIYAPLANLIKQCWDKEPEKRPEGKEVLEKLATFQKSNPTLFSPRKKIDNKEVSEELRISNSM